MKRSKRKVVVLSLLICLLALLTTMGSLAWFSASDSVENKFMVADSTDTDPDDIFSIDVWEQHDSNGDNDFNEVDDVKRTDDGLVYDDILPGDKLSKIAHVTNTGHYDQYVRVTVTISDATAWINALGEDVKVEELFVGFDSSKWNNISKKIEGETDTVTYVLYYNDILTSGEDITLFTHVQIPTSLTQAQAAEFDGDFTIDVKAEAVQTENVGSNAYEAFATVENN